MSHTSRCHANIQFIDFINITSDSNVIHCSKATALLNVTTANREYKKNSNNKTIEENRNCTESYRNDWITKTNLQLVLERIYFDQSTIPWARKFILLNDSRKSIAYIFNIFVESTREFTLLNLLKSYLIEIYLTILFPQNRVPYNIWFSSFHFQSHVQKRKNLAKNLLLLTCINEMVIWIAVL